MTTMCVVAGLTLISGSARAWVESEVRSQLATVDVNRAGMAIVTEDLTLAVRGGPLPGFELSGVDLDAELLPDATVSSVPGTKSDLPATPVLIDKRDDGTLVLELDREKGLRTGLYLFHIRYRTNLLKRDRIRREGSDVEVRWIGPRFAQGIDSARVIFRLPAGPSAPRLPDANESTGRMDDTDALGGVFIGNLHRLADKDELDIVRPHVSRGEPVLWRVLASAKAFDAFANPPPPVNALKRAPGSPSLALAAAQPGQRLTWWLAAALGALAYSFAVAGKWRVFADMCRVRGVTPRALLQIPVGPRAAASGCLVAGAFISAAWFDRATLGSALLVTAMALAVQFAVPAKTVLRGPGRWLPLSDTEAFARSGERVPGRFLDAGTLPGLAIFLLGCAGFIGGAWCLFARVPYQSLLVVLGMPCLLPLFFTGRFAQLPAELALATRPLLASVAKKLRRRPGIKVVAWARIPDGARDPDEVRLLIQVPGATRGLLGIEVGVELTPGLAGSASTLFTLVRAREGSQAISALPRNVVWTRGRKSDERAAVLRPRLPTQANCVELVLSLVKLVREKDSSRAPVATGRAQRTVRPRSASSPAHVA